MNDKQFDNLTRAFADGVSRRQMIKLLVSALATGLLTLLGYNSSKGQNPNDPPTPSPTLEYKIFLPIVSKPCLIQTVSCPDCGTCTECNIDQNTGTSTCGACSNLCLAASICKQANQDVAHQKIVCYLADQGFKQTRKAEALVLNEDGALVGSAISTPYTHLNDHSQTAEIFYAISTTGEIKTFALIYQDGKPSHGLNVGNFGQIEIVFPTQSLTGDMIHYTEVLGASSSCRQCLDLCGTWLCGFAIGFAFCTTWSTIVCIFFTGPAAIACALAAAAGCFVGALDCASRYCPTKICCPEGGTCCDDGCVDLSSDSNNCGECGNTCSDSQICCNGGCVEANTNLNCGGCGVICDQTCCGGVCVDTTADPNNCGGCGITCSGGGCSQCVQGGCESGCDPGQACCGEECIDPSQYQCCSITGFGEISCTLEEQCCGNGTCCAPNEACCPSDSGGWTCVPWPSEMSCGVRTCQRCPDGHICCLSNGAAIGCCDPNDITCQNLCDNA